MQCKKLFDKIDELYKDYITVWEDVCNIESPTDFKKGVDAVAVYFCQMAIKHGWRVETFNHPVAGNAVCITMNPDADAKPASFSGHMDTVHPLGAFGTPPVHRDKEKIYGPGVADCKGGIVAGFLAMDALERCGFKSRPIQLLLQSDEERSISNKATIGYICDKAKDSVAFLNLESHYPGKVCLSRKGTINFTFSITGKEAHSSECAKSGANAIAEAAHKILELEKIKDESGITCCCSIISGGSVTNTVPGRCEFKANVRFTTNEQLEWAIWHMNKIAQTVYVPGCTCVVTYGRGRVAMELNDRNIHLLNVMNDIYKQNGLPILEIKNGTGASDAADVTAFGIPCVDSLGVEGDCIHSTDEYALLGSLKESAKRIAAVAYCI